MTCYVERLYKSAPPVVECSYTQNELKSLERLSLKRVSDLLSEINDGLRGNQHLDTEIQVFRLLIYKVVSVIRNDKQLHNLTKVRTCIRRLVQMNLPETANNINEQLKAAYKPFNIKLKGEKNVGVKLPSRQQFEFLQVQIMAATKLIVCILRTIANAHKGSLQKIAMGHFIEQNLLRSSSLSRLWVLLKAYLLKCVELYQTLSPLLSQLKGTPAQWFPINEKFPLLLNDWLGIATLEELPVE